MSRPAAIDPASVRRILVRATNWIGDVVMIAPSIAALRRRYPGARLEAAGVPSVAEVLRAVPGIDEVIPFDRRGRDGGILGAVRFARSLRARRYDLAVVFPKSIGTAIQARLARIPRRVGLATDRRAWLLTDAVPFTADLASRHHLEIFAEVARAAGAEVPAGEPPTLVLPEEARQWAGRFLAEHGPGSDRGESASAAGRSVRPPLIGLHAGASKRPRAWHLERLIEAARRVAEPRGGGYLLLGGGGEAGDMDRAAAALGNRAVNAAGRTSVLQMAALLERCDLLIGNDSGPMHLAGALGVPVVAIFGPGDPDRTAPYRAARAEVVSRRYPCAPCRQRFFRECYPDPHGKPMCLASIGVDEVVAAASRLLTSA